MSGPIMNTPRLMSGPTMSTPQITCEPSESELKLVVAGAGRLEIGVPWSEVCALAGTMLQLWMQHQARGGPHETDPR